MPQNDILIASRIKSERKRAGLTQIELAGKLGVSEKSVKNFEKNGPDKISDLVAMSKLFRCSVDYLLGNEPCRLHKNTDISQVTGLTEYAIDKLTTYSNIDVFEEETINRFANFSSIVSMLITSPEFDKIFYIIEKIIHLEISSRISNIKYKNISDNVNLDSVLEYESIGNQYVITNSSFAKDVEIEKAVDLFKTFLKRFSQLCNIKISDGS